MVVKMRRRKGIVYICPKCGFEAHSVLSMNGHIEYEEILRKQEMKRRGSHEQPMKSS